jgi:hypothetical protein
MGSTVAGAEGDLNRLLRRPGYIRFVLTVSFSRIGVTMFNTAEVLLVLARTGSTTLAGVRAAAARCRERCPGRYSGRGSTSPARGAC